MGYIKAFAQSQRSSGHDSSILSLKQSCKNALLSFLVTQFNRSPVLFQAYNLILDSYANEHLGMLYK